MNIRFHINHNLQSLILLVVFALQFPSLSDAQHAGNIKPDPVKRREWLLQTKTEMLEFSLLDTVKRLSPQFDQYETYTRISYQLQKKGVIFIGENDWIYIVSSNSHEQPEVGDLTVAMDQDHNFYLNRGHVCGGIARYFSDDLPELTTTSLFFSHFKEDIDLLSWVKWDN